MSKELAATCRRLLVEAYDRQELAIRRQLAELTGDPNDLILSGQTHKRSVSAAAKIPVPRCPSH
jgi:hypothetical protein